MKLFLSSQAISKEQAPHLMKLVGKPARSIKIAVIENAADVEEGSKGWLMRNRQMIESHGFDVEYIDLKNYGQDLETLHTKLADKDVIWFGGGNVYYLRWLLRDTGAENIIKDLVQNGVVYGGGSAGAIVAGPTLHHFEVADDPKASPGVIYEGLSLTNKVIVPHIDNKKYAAIVRGIDDKLKADGFRTVPLGDARALVVDGDREMII
ncbi:MAG TPA: Type 1 glutamine amidotransferase-like domain-containing protein [Candidatus Saccharimonadales bacterium]|nr:Type 1 glutamine amidotransferase-like domain-containing protein [Candidatus Saccharimonadales bacterium]